MRRCSGPCLHGSTGWVPGMRYLIRMRSQVPAEGRKSSERRRAPWWSKGLLRPFVSLSEEQCHAENRTILFCPTKLNVVNQNESSDCISIVLPSGLLHEETTDISSTNSSDSSGVCRYLQSPTAFPDVVPVVFLASLFRGHYVYSTHKELRPEQAGWYQIWEFKHGSNNLSCTGKEQCISQ